MPYVHGFLRLGKRNGLRHPDNSLPEEGEGPVDPDYGIDEGEGGGHHPDNGLPPLGWHRPGNGLPKPPPGVFPPLTPSHPIQPAPPQVPPGAIWPPVDYPDNALPGSPPGVDNTLPGSPPGVDNSLPSGGGNHPSQGLPGRQKFWVVAGIPGVGWRYICVDPSLRPGNALPPTPTPK